MFRKRDICIQDMPDDLKKFLVANGVDTFTIKKDSTGFNSICIPNTRKNRKLLRHRIEHD